MFYHSFKIFRCFPWAPIPRLNLEDVLSNISSIGRYSPALEKRLIDGIFLETRLLGQQ